MLRLAWSRLPAAVSQLAVRAMCCVLGALLLVGYAPVAHASAASERAEVHADGSSPLRDDAAVVPGEVEPEAEDSETQPAPCGALPAPNPRARQEYVSLAPHHQLVPATGPPASTDERPTRILHDRTQPARGPPARS